MSLSPWVDEHETPETDVRQLPTAFVRKEIRCERCHAKLLPLLRGETAARIMPTGRRAGAKAARLDMAAMI